MARISQGELLSAVTGPENCHVVCACQSVNKYLSGILSAPHVIGSGKQDKRKKLLPSGSLSSNELDVISTNKR